MLLALTGNINMSCLMSCVTHGDWSRCLQSTKVPFLFACAVKSCFKLFVGEGGGACFLHLKLWFW
jgi:hypothetical protein